MWSFVFLRAEVWTSKLPTLIHLHLGALIIIIINTILYGLFGGRKRRGGAESAHPHKNVPKMYLCYEIDVKQLYGV